MIIVGDSKSGLTLISQTMKSKQFRASVINAPVKARREYGLSAGFRSGKQRSMDCRVVKINVLCANESLMARKVIRQQNRTQWLLKI